MFVLPLREVFQTETDLIRLEDALSVCSAYCPDDDGSCSKAGLVRVKCKDCQYNIRHCDCADCYLYCSDECPVHETVK